MICALRNAACILALVAAGGACSRGEPQSKATFERIDSAGVAVAVNTALIGDLPVIVTAADTPRLRIGAEDRGEPYQFDGIRGVVRLADGRIAVANGTPPEVRVFDEAGEFVKRLGRRGPGPGEFSSVAQLISLGGDTVAAVDGMVEGGAFKRLRFTVNGGYVDSRPSPRATAALREVELRPTEGIEEYFRDGAGLLAARPYADSSMYDRRHPTGELFRPTNSLVWLSPDRSAVRVIGRYGEIQQMFVTVGGGRRHPVIPPGARRRISAMNGTGSRFCISDAERPEVDCIDADGSHLRIRWLQDTIPVTSDMVEQWREAHRNRTRGFTSRSTGPEIEQMIAGVIIPPTLPSIQGILVDTEGRIFVASPGLHSPTRGRSHWRVFSADGELLGLADLPGAQVHALGPDYLIGVRRDAEGVETIVVHDLASSPPISRR